MKLIGLTGGVASGKSSVAKIFQDQGVVVVDADALAREVVEAGTFGLNAVVEVFGRDVLDSAGQNLDRAKLRSKLINDEKSRLLLERIIHPLVHWRARREFEHLEKQGQSVVVYDVPLLFEKAMEDQFDFVIVVKTPADLQIQRLKSRDKMSDSDAEKFVATQMPMEKKAARAHFVVDNSGTIENTRKQVLSLIGSLKS